MKTKKQSVAWAKSKIGTGVDWDGVYGFQCMDLTVAYLNYVTNGKVTMRDNAIDAPRNSFGDTAKVIKNYPAFVPKAGDLVVWTSGNFSTYGHIAIVLDGNPGGDLTTITVAEQNWLGGGANKTELTTKRVHNYTGITHFIRPNFASEPIKKETDKKESTKATSKTKAKKLTVSTSRINYTMTKRGHKPKSITIHNDAGSAGATAKNYEKGLTNASNSRYEQGVAHAYVSGNYAWEAISEDRIAWHVADGVDPGSGNFESYGIEVCQSTGDKNTFLDNEQSVFQFVAEKLTKWGLPANRNTIRLHNEFSSTACPHRSTELHGGFNPLTQGKASSEVNLKVKDYFIKNIRKYMNGEVPTSTVVKPSSSTTTTSKPSTGGSNVGNKFNFNGLSTNPHGTKWYYENNSFTCRARAGIITRVGSPYTTAPQAGVLYYGQTVTYNQVAVNNKEPYVWISWITNNGTEVWMPIEVLDKNNVITEQWGDFAW